MATYEATLKAAREVGASNATEPQLMALYCEGPLQILGGAVSPKLVWQGAQAKGMTTIELGKLAVTDPLAVSELMWL